jgi:hypothetical protein
MPVSVLPGAGKLTTIMIDDRRIAAGVRKTREAAPSA